MYSNAGYLNNSIQAFADNAQPLVVGSCGNYRIQGREEFHTRRPEGRVDYQLLYVVSGKTYFYIEQQERVVTAGHMVLYRPGQMQDYVYYGQDKPEIFWVHFTGRDVEDILEHYGICREDTVFFSGNSSAYAELFREMIGELQTCRTGFEELLAMYLRQIFLLIRRSKQIPKIAGARVQEEMEWALQYFNEHYAEPVQIEAYARSRGMSVSWFLRGFKQLTQKSPVQYITAVRINNAVNLLENTNYNITEVAAMVGYEDPLYFSRIFRKHKGISPSRYRRTLLEKTGAQ